MIGSGSLTVAFMGKAQPATRYSTASLFALQHSTTDCDEHSMLKHGNRCCNMALQRSLRWYGGDGQMASGRLCA
jgi:hypothetical protein